MKKASELAKASAIHFADLMAMVAKLFQTCDSALPPTHKIWRIRVKTIAKYKNICNYIHLPVQSGSSRILLMNRGHNRDEYIALIECIRRIILAVPSHDMISGFPRTEEDIWKP